MNIEQFENTFKPVDNPLSNNWFFDTHGQDMELINNTPASLVWTVVDTDGKLYAIQGKHFVNRFAYITCALPHTNNENVEVLIE